MDYAKLASSLKTSSSKPDLYEAIVNAPFATKEAKLEAAYLFLGIIVLLIVDKKAGTINRIALSQTELAKNTTTVSVKEFKDIKVPIDYEDNIIATAIRTGQPQGTTDWQDLFAPELSSKEARINQASGGIYYSAVYPLLGVGDGAAMIFSYYQYEDEIGDSQRLFMKNYSKLAAEALVHSYKFKN